MKRSATVFLRAVIVLIAIGVLAFLLWEPHIEGRNAQATLFTVYFRDAFLAYVYAGSAPFFIGLYQAFRILTYAGRNQEFTPPVVQAVRSIKFCAMALIALVGGGEVFIMLSESDDRAGGVAIGIFLVCASAVVAATMAVIQPALEQAVAVKS